MRGRKPQSTASKIASGVQSDRINWLEPKPQLGIPERPDHLDPVAIETWDRMVTTLSGLGILTTADGDALESFCSTNSMYRAALADIAERGIVVEGRSGPTKNPAVGVAEKAREYMLRVLAEFGLTPASRSKVKTNAPAVDALTAFIGE